VKHCQTSNWWLLIVQKRKKLVGLSIHLNRAKGIVDKNVIGKQIDKATAHVVNLPKTKDTA